MKVRTSGLRGSALMALSYLAITAFVAGPAPPAVADVDDIGSNYFGDVPVALGAPAIHTAAVAADAHVEDIVLGWPLGADNVAFVSSECMMHGCYNLDEPRVHEDPGRAFASANVHADILLTVAAELHIDPGRVDILANTGLPIATSFDDTGQTCSIGNLPAATHIQHGYAELGGEVNMLHSYARPRHVPVLEHGAAARSTAG